MLPLVDKPERGQPCSDLCRGILAIGEGKGQLVFDETNSYTLITILCYP